MEDRPADGNRTTDLAPFEKKSVKKSSSRQARVLANLARVVTDGSRHNPMFWLDGDNVSAQVRSLIARGDIALQEGRLVRATKVRTNSAVHDPADFVRTMRALCGVTGSLPRDNSSKTTRRPAGIGVALPVAAPSAAKADAVEMMRTAANSASFFDDFNPVSAKKETMDLSVMQAKVLANIERVRAIEFESLHLQVVRYELDGVHCTSHIDLLLKRKLIEPKDRKNGFKRVGD